MCATTRTQPRWSRASNLKPEQFMIVQNVPIANSVLRGGQSAFVRSPVESDTLSTDFCAAF
jgi:hypothetical protein